MIVFIHGLGCDASSLEPMAACMNDNRDKWVVSLPKNARSESISKLKLLDTAVMDISSRLESVREVHIVAHSLGAAIALPIALRIGNKLKSMTIFEGNLTADDCGILSNKLSVLETKEAVSEFVESFISSSDIGLKAWAKMAKQYDSNTLVGYAKELVAVSKSERLLEIFLKLKCAKLYVFGDDYVGHPTMMKIWSADSRHLEGTSHFAILEQPEACAQLIDQTMNSATVKIVSR